MIKISKFIKLIICYLLILIILFFFINITDIFNNKFPLKLAYVYSDSMNPTLKANDGFILVKHKEYYINDVITFSPKEIDAPYVTHRIVNLTEDGKYLTKGDNNSLTDQQNGEPLVNIDQIKGKVFTINGKVLSIPYLDNISNFFKKLFFRINTFNILVIIIILILISYVIDISFNKTKKYNRKNYKLIEVAPYFHILFIIFCILLFINVFFISNTIKSWGFDEVSYVVVNTKGVSSPNPLQEFDKTKSLKNTSLVPFVIKLENRSENIKDMPKTFNLSYKEEKDYSIAIIAPKNIGFYSEKIYIKSYPKILPKNWFDYLYNKNSILPLIVIFAPGILITICILICWIIYWNSDKKEVMNWLIPYRRVFRRFFK